MSEILFRYERVAPTTWAYLSAFLVIALYFKFSRVWSVRNLDLIILILLSPALLLVKYGIDRGAATGGAALVEHIGYIWLFSVNGCLLLRLLLDASMVRRPLLDPNLSVGGLTFLGISLFVFLMANVVTGTPSEADLAASQRAAQLQNREASQAELNTLKTDGPGFPLIYLLPQISTQSLLGKDAENVAQVAESGATSVRLVNVVTARVMAILAQLAIVLGMMLVGLRHFDSIRAGIAAATLYLLLPYTAMWTGSVTHALPAALVVWAIVLYRRPLFAGAMLGLAFGTIYYPMFLLPLWISFYWRRGLIRFLLGFFAMVGVLVITLAFTSSDMAMFLARLQQMFGIQFPVGEQLRGAWQFWNEVYRYPILAAFIGLCLSFVLWPAQKNLATLLSCSAAIMLGTQFWHAYGGGLALAWYLPLLLLTVFRPNLEDRIATNVIKSSRKQEKAN
jgi:hypothetical protein